MSRHKKGHRQSNTVESLVNQAFEQVDRSKHTQMKKANIRKQRFSSLIYRLADHWLQQIQEEKDLPDLTVMEVVPHPFVDQYLIVFRGELTPHEADEWTNYLQSRTGVLRSILAETVQSKGTPTFTIDVLSEWETQR